MKQEIITYLAGPRNFIQGVELYEKYGINRMLKKSFRRQGETETMKAILLEELRKLAGLSEREFKTIRRNSKQPTAVKMEPARDETSKTSVKYSDDLLLELAESFGVSVEELVSSDFRDKVLSMDPVTFFNKANELMVKNSPAAADKEMLEKIAAVNVGPGMEFDASVLTGDVAKSWKTMLTEIRPKLVKEGMKFSKRLGQWSYFGAPIGDCNTEYAYRALVALAGLGANTVEVALYAKTEQDADGNLLTGEKSFTLHFESYPQVLEGGFWSVTAYGDDDFLIDNPIDRYCINDRSGLKANEDGSVDVILSKDAPEDTTNWLPVGDGGFHLYMRIYTPDMDALDTWTAPTITELDPANVN